ncbi:ABC-2 type transport system ATP-binding protein [Mesorhizobium sp. J18]|uniref:ABC transporter ATP-binding protein n=1 Tax=Mesorhizobium sp. J18 TaxID=935263 RepID=UPI00119A10D5|nr:ABC transporter ATP-binding protein [Mesorhizobium sp. J18]TWG92454.1 ABC-2 type transport system ATP-binding protein [Mesorhizobium sp. J18]
MSVVIETKGLVKRYRGHVAVNGVDLTIERGEVFGLLGPNGSGKTTTILLLLGLTEPSGGTVSVLGLNPLRDPLSVKQRVAFLPDQVGFYDQLTARENLVYTARLAGIESGMAHRRIDESLARVRLEAVADRRVGTFSRGMRQRLGIAEIILKQPEIAILDEPTSGLDPQSTHELLTLIGDLARGGMTIVLSSHLLDMVQSICNRVALFNRGKIGLCGPVETLMGDVMGGTHTVEVDAAGIDLKEILAGKPHVMRVRQDRQNNWRVDTDADVRPEIARHIIAAGGELRRMSIRQTSLDDVYVRYFEEAANVQAA